jgi:hypothetical protein
LPKLRLTDPPLPFDPSHFEPWPPTIIEVTVTGVVVESSNTTRSGLANVAPAARPVMVVAVVRAYTTGVVLSLLRIEIDVPAT